MVHLAVATTGWATLYFEITLQISAEVFETHKIPMTKKERSNLRGRLGNLNNELGSFYQNRVAIQ